VDGMPPRGEVNREGLDGVADNRRTEMPPRVGATIPRNRLLSLIGAVPLTALRYPTPPWAEATIPRNRAHVGPSGERTAPAKPMPPGAVTRHGAGCRGGRHSAHLAGSSSRGGARRHPGAPERSAVDAR